MRTALQIPTSVWSIVGSYCNAPYELQNLASVCVTARLALSSDAFWKQFCPYDIAENYYQHYLDSMRRSSKISKAIALRYWVSVALEKAESLAQPEPGYLQLDDEEVGEHENRHEYSGADFYIALPEFLDFAMKNRDDRGENWRFAACLRNRAFVRTAIALSETVYTYYETIQTDPEYCLLAIEWAFRTKDSRVFSCVPYELYFNSSFMDPIREKCAEDYFFDVYNSQKLCDDPALILKVVQSDEYSELLVFEQHVWIRIAPEIKTIELYCELAKAGFPIQDFVPVHFERNFILQCPFKEIPPEFEDDRDVVASIVHRNGKALQNASLRLKADREIVCSALKANLGALAYCDADSLAQDEEFVHRFELLLSDDAQGLWVSIPESLQQQDTAERVIKRSGRWLPYFNKLVGQKHLQCLAVRTEPAVVAALDISDEEHVATLCSINPSVIFYTPISFIRNHSSWFEHALRSCTEADLMILQCSLRSELNPDLAGIIVRRHPSAFMEFVTSFPSIYHDKELLLLAASYNGAVMWNAPADMQDDHELWEEVRTLRS